MNAFVSILAIAAAILMIAGWWKMRTDQKKGKKSKGSYLLIAPATVLMVLYIILAIAHRNQPIVQETPDERSCIITGDLTGIDFRNPVIEVLDYWHRDSVLARGKDFGSIGALHPGRFAINGNIGTSGDRGNL